MVAAVAAGELEERAFAALHRPVVPGEVGGGGVLARRGQRHDRGVVAAELVGAAEPGIVDLGDEVALAQADGGDFADAGVDRLDDARGAAHVFDLLRRFDGALPVDEAGRVDEARVRQLVLKGEIGLGGEVVVVELEADALVAVAAVADDAGEKLHRVAVARLHVGVGIGDEAVVAHVDGADGAVQVLRAAPPDRVLVGEHQHALVDIERPAVVAGEPGHVGRVLDEEEVDAGLRHGATGLGEPFGIFGAGKRQDGCAHGRFPQAEKIWPAPAAVARSKARVAMAVSWTPVPVRSQSVS